VTIIGWDMSVWDDPGIGNAIDQGVSFITHKAGGDRDDPELAAWWAGIRGHRDRLLVGAYWVLYPGHPTARADAFLARLDDQCPGWRDGPFILQVDCERWNNDPATVPGRAEIAAFCDRLVAQMPKLRPIVYAPKWVYENSLDGLKYPTWASNYVPGSGSARALYPGDSSARWAPYSGEVPAILPYSSSAVIGGQSTSDADAYRGTLAQLTALVAPGWSEDVNVDDLINNTAPDGTPPATPLGHWALSQGIKDGTLNGQRVAAWQAIQNLGTQLVAARADVAALQKQVAALAARYGIVVDADLNTVVPAPLPIEEAVYRIAQEALHNIVKHARAGAVELRLEQAADGLVLVVEDDGRGFETGGSFPGHLGLRSMRERAAELGGTLTLAEAVPQGTIVEVVVPR